MAPSSLPFICVYVLRRALTVFILLCFRYWFWAPVSCCIWAHVRRMTVLSDTDEVEGSYKAVWYIAKQVEISNPAVVKSCPSNDDCIVWTAYAS